MPRKVRVGGGRACPRRRRAVVDQLLLARRQHAVRRQALDRERAGDADAGIVRDRACRRDIRRRRARRCWRRSRFWRAIRASHHLACGSAAAAGAAGGQLARDLPFLPSFAGRGVERGAQRLEHRLPLLPDVVDQRIVGDRLERDVRHALIDEALADIVMDRRVRGRAPAELGLLRAALAAVGEQIPGIARRHQPRARQRQRDAAGVDRDPAPAPLLGDIGGGAGAAGGIEDQVAGVGGHQDAALDHLGAGLDDVVFSSVKLPVAVSVQMFVIAIDAESRRVPHIAERVCGDVKPRRLSSTFHAGDIGLPMPVRTAPIGPALEREIGGRTGRTLRRRERLC